MAQGNMTSHVLTPNKNEKKWSKITIDTIRNRINMVIKEGQSSSNFGKTNKQKIWSESF